LVFVFFGEYEIGMRRSAIEEQLRAWSVRALMWLLLHFTLSASGM
jgi:hypothetical protein